MMSLKFVRSDETVIEAAFTCTGQYHFVDEFQSFNVGSKWWSVSPPKRNAHLKKFLQACRNRSHDALLTTDTPQIPQSMEAQSEHSESVPEDDFGFLSGKCQALPSVNIRNNILTGMLEKADKIFKENLVSDIKGREKQVAIDSQSDLYPCVVIWENRTRRGEAIVELKCGAARGCLNFSTHNMCSHTQAAALY